MNDFDLHHLDSNGNFPLGIKVSLTYAQIAFIFETVHRYQVNLFIELGVHQGGIGSILRLREVYVPEFKYLGVELHRNGIDVRLLDFERGSYIWGDAFSKEVYWDIRDLVRHDYGSDRVLLFCDNGDKPREVREYHDILKDGDILLVHDWNKEISWNDCEFLLNKGFTHEPHAFRFGLGMFIKE